jgi:hypothetical protein
MPKIKNHRIEYFFEKMVKQSILIIGTKKAMLSFKESMASCRGD